MQCDSVHWSVKMPYRHSRYVVMLFEAHYCICCNKAVGMTKSSTQLQSIVGVSTLAMTPTRLCGSKTTWSCSNTLATFIPWVSMESRFRMRRRALPFICSVYCSVMIQQWLCSKKLSPGIASELSSLATTKSPMTSMPTKFILTPRIYYLQHQLVCGFPN